MPEPMGRGQRYMPGLDGLRALAVAAVIAYHLGVSWAPGGLLGVGVFFTLSGYLITDLLLGSWESNGNLQLRNFWARRARRLLPALFVMLVVVTIWVGMARPSQLGPLRGDVAAATGYVSNWWLSLQHVSYFARFGPPSPLGHLWSLAVEEQFYLLWPWLLLAGLLWVARRRQRARAAAAAPVAALSDNVPGPNGDGSPAPRPASPAPRPASPAPSPAGTATFSRSPFGSARKELWPLAGITLIVALASTIEMAVLYHPSFDPSRVYYGTDTRAFGLLIGAALAMVWPSRGLRAHVSPGARRLVDGMGAVGLVAIALLVWRTDQYSAFLYRGGMLLLSVATALVVASAVHPAGHLGRLLGVRPLRWTGVRSYGMYLWHYPVIVLTTATVVAGTDVPARTDLPRDILQVAAIVGLAELSWRFIETPVRNGATGRLIAKLRALRWRVGALPRADRWALGSLPAALLLSSLCLAGLMPAAPSGILAASATSSGQLVTPPSELVGTSTQATPPTTVVPSSGPSTLGLRSSQGLHSHGPGSVAGRGTGTDPGATQQATLPPSDPKSASSTRVGAGDPLTTSCKQVVQLGDSTSDSLVSATYLPDPSQRLAAQYARVGVSTSIMEIVGGNSIVETLPGEQNAYQLAQGLVAQGYRGCWVVALGTNDAADVYVGSNVGMAARIQRMMSLIGHQPVLWVNVKTLLASGPYSESNMESWDNALVNACAEYPNMRVFNWAAIAKPTWFTSDGIHYNSPGSAPRAAAIADALATAFPASTGPVDSHIAPAGRRAQANAAQSPAANCVVDEGANWQLPTFQY